MKVQFLKLDNPIQLNPKHRMIKHYRSSHVLLDWKGDKIAQISFYATDKTTSCCLWVFGHQERAGSGKSNMLGGSQRLEALKRALESAGIRITEGKVSYSGKSIEKLLMAFLPECGHISGYITDVHA